MKRGLFHRFRVGLLYLYKAKVRLKIASLTLMSWGGTFIERGSEGVIERGTEGFHRKGYRGDIWGAFIQRGMGGFIQRGTEGGS